MSSTVKLLVVVKYTTLERLPPTDLHRLERRGIADGQRLREALHAHETSRRLVIEACAGYEFCERRIDQVTNRDFAWCDAVVTIGGDGTVFGVNPHLDEKPVIAVNSDPDRSIGHFTRCRAESFGDILAAWQDESVVIERVPRLQITIDQRSPIPFVNDCLFTNRNPAAMSRYLIGTDGSDELQYSSGVWISTAAGSTGAISSAGMNPCDRSAEALLYQVREPFQKRQQFSILSGKQLPPKYLSITAAIPGHGLYIDGAHSVWSLAAGEQAYISACPTPLLLMSLPSSNGSAL